MLFYHEDRADDLFCIFAIGLKDQTIHVRLAGVDAPEVRSLSSFLYF